MTEVEKYENKQKLKAAYARAHQNMIWTGENQWTNGMNMNEKWVR